MQILIKKSGKVICSLEQTVEKFRKTSEDDLKANSDSHVWTQTEYNATSWVNIKWVCDRCAMEHFDIGNGVPPVKVTYSCDEWVTMSVHGE